MGRVCTDADAQAAIDRIIEHGEYIRDAAKALNVDYSSMLRKLATPEFKPLADEARMGAAEAQERLAFAALQAIQSGDDQALVTRQVRLSEHHWKSAAVRDPRSYGQRMQVEQTHTFSLATILQDVQGRIEQARDITSECSIIDAQPIASDDDRGM